MNRVFHEKSSRRRTVPLTATAQRILICEYCSFKTPDWLIGHTHPPHNTIYSRYFWVSSRYNYMEHKEKLKIIIKLLLLLSFITKRPLIIPRYRKVYCGLRYYHVYVFLITNIILDIVSISIIHSIFFKVSLCSHRIFNF